MEFYKKYSWFLVIFVFLVILAGGVVRMTQSGMGCPDWPTCFGMLIPPTSADQLPADFEKYLSKQDIDHSFNVYHTWIEYINRLLGAILGLIILFYVYLSFKRFWKVDKVIPYISIALLFAVMFEGWLGKVVVDDNLAVTKVTLHMLGALVIGILPLYNLARISKSYISVSSTIKHITTIVIILLLIQIVLGTQVREEIDLISKQLNYEQRELWISKLGSEFIIHRTFSWLVLIGTLFLFLKRTKFNGYSYYITTSIVLVVVVILLGVIMAYLGMPAISQPLHLLIASILLVQLVYSRIVMN